ncbi:1-acylglycerol-3-phosphate O-acyltransferase [Paraglaciecola sp. 20A4]|uniref:1-acylglycerol-3-phosphate O-acyltransferase n=1 Tax=Paraglaciecola sp. 20A4 TaxID=2687288 RepID=UPI00140C4C68
MLALLRIISVFFYFLLINILLVLICLCRPFHRDNVHLAGKLYSSTSRLLGLKLEVRIAPEAQQGGPYVFIANHQNSFDIFTICAAALKGTVTVGKKSLKWIPIFGQVYWLSGNIMIDRKNSGRAMDTLKNTVNKMGKRKLSVWFFPEGTRSYGRGLLPFKSGAFRIAKLAKRPVIIVAASNLENKIKLNRWDNGTLIIDVGKPYELDNSRTTREWTEYFHQVMQDKIAQLDSEVDASNR